jgi:hypothetical protein
MTINLPEKAACRPECLVIKRCSGFMSQQQVLEGKERKRRTWFAEKHRKATCGFNHALEEASNNNRHHREDDSLRNALSCAISWQGKGGKE